LIAGTWNKGVAHSFDQIVLQFNAMTSFLYCYKHSGASTRHHRKLKTLQCGAFPSSNISAVTTTTDEVRYLYDLTLNSTAIQLETAMRSVKSRLLDNISDGFGGNYVCCNSTSSSTDTSNQNYEEGVFAFALSDVADTEDTSGTQCKTTTESPITCTPIVGNIYLHANSTSLSTDVLGAVEYVMDNGMVNGKKYNATYIGKRSFMSGGWAGVAVDAKDSFLGGVNGIVETVSNNAPQSIGPMGIASAVIGCLFIIGLFAVCIKRRRAARQLKDSQLAEDGENFGLSHTPKTDTSVDNKGANTTFLSEDEEVEYGGMTELQNSLSIVDDVTADDVEITLDPSPTTKRGKNIGK